MFESLWPLTHIWTTKQQHNRRRRPVRKPPPRFRPVVEEVEQRVLLTAYYISPTGNNGNSGTSRDMAWQTIDRVNQQDMNPGFLAGDSINFQGGNTYQGSLQLHSQGNPTNGPITITSYGARTPATINGATSEGLTVTNAEWYHVTNINFVGQDNGTHSNDGIRFVNTQAGSILHHIYVDNVDSGGFGRYGIEVVSYAGGYNDVHITYSAVHNDTVGGLYVGSQSDTDVSQTDEHLVYIGHVQAFHNPGYGIFGCGITLWNTTGGTIERCLAYENGQYGATNLGIFVDRSDQVTVQYCEAWGNMDPTGQDGAGFDLDEGTTNSTIQYCYSHDNDGMGVEVTENAKPGLPANHSNTVRYNVSQNDVRGPLQASKNWGSISIFGQLAARWGSTTPRSITTPSTKAPW